MTDVPPTNESVLFRKPVNASVGVKPVPIVRSVYDLNRVPVIGVDVKYTRNRLDLTHNVMSCGRC